mmetsp:Transcript_8537/g.14668  ORF Transcript_8537/g.14668 Transcript_8537/m.14668 type:complete len:97 (+) Transcript_8537:48-338(+)
MADKESSPQNCKGLIGSSSCIPEVSSSSLLSKTDKLGRQDTGAHKRMVGKSTNKDVCAHSWKSEYQRRSKRLDRTMHSASQKKLGNWHQAADGKKR